MTRPLLIALTALGLASALAGPALAANDEKLERSLQKLDPSELMAQVCDLGGMKAFGASAELKHTDRVMIDALADPRIAGNKVSGSGGALRKEERWYRFSYTCTLSPDHMKVLSFDYKLGPAIPEAKWAELGLWK